MPFSAARLARKPLASISLNGIQPVQIDQAIWYSLPLAGAAIADEPEPAAEPEPTAADPEPVAAAEPEPAVSAEPALPEPAAVSVFLLPQPAISEPIKTPVSMRGVIRIDVLSREISFAVVSWRFHHQAIRTFACIGLLRIRESRAS